MNNRHLEGADYTVHAARDGCAPPRAVTQELRQASAVRQMLLMHAKSMGAGSVEIRTGPFAENPRGTRLQVADILCRDMDASAFRIIQREISLTPRKAGTMLLPAARVRT